MRVLLMTPPLLQGNTPYPATPLLAAWLRAQGVDVCQADASLALLLRLLSAAGLRRVREALAQRPASPDTAFFVTQAEAYIDWVEPVVRFLQGKEPALAYRLVRLGTLPEGPRFEVMRQQEVDEDGSLRWAFGTLGVADQARYLASLFIDDIAAAVTRGLDPGFGLSRYEERLCQSLPSLAPLRARLDGPSTLIDRLIDEVAAEALAAHRPDLIGLTVPFPGTLYGALRLARASRRLNPAVRLVLGGGYVNTELRDLQDAGLFDEVDYVCLDDGFQALGGVVRQAAGGGDAGLVRTFVRVNGAVRFVEGSAEPGPRHGDLPAPDYTSLPLSDYLPLTEMLNPMQVLWSSQRWTKLMVAHGCYWRRCAFCDTTLDYIHRFEQPTPERVLDWMEDLRRQTGCQAFHLVDEALPPALLRRLGAEILRRRLVVTWWGNIRLEAAFDADLARQLAESGCIAVTGGLEALDERLLGLLNKGITMAEAVRACAALTGAGIMVHAYLMYGVPTETEQETVDALERLRQMFALGLIRSAFWHRFAATTHSVIGAEPQRFGIRLDPIPSTFARNEIAFVDPLGVDHDALGDGLRRAVYNYMHGMGLDEDVRSWFRAAVPRSRVAPDAIARILRGETPQPARPAAALRPPRPGRRRPPRPRSGR
jgi:radical SAM superfamily enzyme YgiQ (UPF0313 family)